MRVSAVGVGLGQLSLGSRVQVRPVRVRRGLARQSGLGEFMHGCPVLASKSSYVWVRQPR